MIVTRYPKIKNDKNMEILFSGSFKFFDEMKRLSQKLGKIGLKCILPKFSLQKFSSKEIEKIKENREQYGLRNGELEKIVEIKRWYYERLKSCDLMIVVNKDGYIGLSVAAEIGAAHILEKPVFFLEEPKDDGIKALSKISPNFKVVPLENIIDELKKLKDKKQKEIKEKIPPKECDHTSVGILIWQKDKLLLIERKKFPFGFAPPAGHCDGDSYEIAAKRELEEEVGLRAKELSIVTEGRKDNSCRRKEGNYHYWKIYQAKVTGQLRPSEDETKQAGWYTKEQLLQLARKTEDYLSGRIAEEDWQDSPGLESVWYEWFKELGII